MPTDPLLSVQVQVSTTTRSLADMLAGNAALLDQASEVWIDPQGPIRMAFADDADANTGLVFDPATTGFQKFTATMIKEATFYAAANTFMNVELFGQAA